MTHDQTEALTLGDRIAVLRAGRLQQVGSPPSCMNIPNNLFVASLVGDRSHGRTIKPTVDVLESLGSEYYARFEVASERASSSELEELAQDSGAAELGRSREGVQVVAPQRAQRAGTRRIAAAAAVGMGAAD